MRAPSLLGMTVASPPSMTAMQLFVVPRSIPSTFAIIFFSTFFRPPWATQDLSKDRAKRLEIVQNPNFQGKYAVTHDTPATPIATICHIVADLFMLAFHRAACLAIYGNRSNRPFTRVPRGLSPVVLLHSMFRFEALPPKPPKTACTNLLAG